MAVPSEKRSPAPKQDSAERLGRIIWRNSWPVLGLMFLNFLVGYTDIYVAGLLGADVQAGVGFISQQYFLLIILGNALGIGTVAMVSQASGRNRWDRVFDIARQTLILTTSLGIALSTMAFVSAPAFIELFGLPGDVRPLALTYLRIYALALLPNYIIIVAGALFRAVGKPLAAFYIMAIVTCLNVGANFGLVFGFGPLPRMGYPGIGWATVSAMVAGSACVIILLCGSAWRPIWNERWRLSWAIVSRISQISWPAVLLQISWNAGSLTIYHFLGHLGQNSVSAMAAYAAGLRLESLTFLPAFALNMAAAVLVGQSLGAGDIEQAKRIGWRMAVAGSLALTLLAGLLFWKSPWLAGILTADPKVWAETVRYLRINLLVAPLMVLSMVLGGAMQGAGDTRGVMIIIVLAIWVIRIPLAAILCFGLGMEALGVWIAMDISMAIQAVLMLRRFSQGHWHKTPTF